MKYTEEEISFIAENWDKLSKIEIAERLYNHNWKSISNKARSLGLKRSIDNRSSKLKTLTDVNNIENHYWWGFILSDGHISKKGELTIQLSDKDIDHLFKISKILDKKIYKVKNGMHKITCMDKYYAKILCDIIGIDILKPKTYNPPKITKYTENPEIALSLLIGFIDGDGSIGYRDTKNGKSFQSIRIQVHECWYSFLDLLLGIVNQKYNIPFNIKKITRQLENRSIDICQVVICSNKSYTNFINHIKTKNLPVLKRKWQHEKSN